MLAAVWQQAGWQQVGSSLAAVWKQFGSSINEEVFERSHIANGGIVPPMMWEGGWE